MKTMHLVPLLSVLMLTSAFAQNRRGADATDERRSIPIAAPGDGFIMRGTDAVVIRNGVAAKILTEVVLPNGLRVQANGDVTMRNGDSSALRKDRLLTPEGVFVDVPAVDRDLATLPSGQVKSSAKAEVGISDRDGITISGADVLITRNGVTEKVKSDVKLPNGVVVKSDGTVRKSDGSKIALRSDQLLDLHGVLHEAPVRPNPAGPDPSSSSPKQ
jgi:hypothetical protein